MLPQKWIDYNQEIKNSINNLRMDLSYDQNIWAFIFSYIQRNQKFNILGVLGDNLTDFLESCDLNHVEFPIFLENFLGKDVIQEIEEIIEIANFCKRKNYKSYEKRLYLLATKFKKENLLLNGRTLSDPSITNIHTRFLQKNEIWKTRNSKKQQVITRSKILGIHEKKSLNEDLFICYHHNSEKTQELKNELENRKLIFQQLNCLQMLHEIDDALQKLNSEIMMKNFGFRRITLNAMAHALKDYYKSDDASFICPVTEDLYLKNEYVKSFVDLCDNFPIFQNKYSVFDHFGLVGLDNQKNYILVGERDTQTFFIGYIYHEFDN